MCADEDGDLLIESAVKNVPKVFVVSTLVSVMPAQPFIFRNYQVQHLLLLFFLFTNLHSPAYSSCVSCISCSLFSICSIRLEHRKCHMHFQIIQAAVH